MTFCAVVFAQTTFYISNLIRVEVETCKADAQQAVKVALALETTPHYTQNLHYFQTLREKWLAHYKTVRTKPSKYKASVVGPSDVFPEDCEEIHGSPELCATPSPWIPPPPRPASGRPYAPSPMVMEPRFCPPVETSEAKALRALAEAGYPNVRVSDLARLLPPDSWEEELVVMADVRAYYQVSYKVSYSYAHQLHFEVSDSSSSVSSTIFLSRSSMLSIMPWRNNFRRASSRVC